MIATFLFWLLALNRDIKRVLQVIFDLLSVAFAGLVTAILLPFLSATGALALAVSVAVFAALVVVIGHFLGLYRTLIRSHGVCVVAHIRHHIKQRSQ